MKRFRNRELTRENEKSTYFDRVRLNKIVRTAMMLVLICGIQAGLLAGELPILKAQSGTDQSVLVEVFSGSVFAFDAPYRKQAGGKKLVKGKNYVPVGKWLRAAPRQRQSPGAVYQVWLMSGPKKVATTDWIALFPMDRSVAAQYRRALAQVARPAGRPKGEPLQVSLWNPARFGKNWAGELHLRWAPISGKRLTLRIVAGNPAETLWSADDVPAEAGVAGGADVGEAVALATTAGKLPISLEVSGPGIRESLPLVVTDPESDSELVTELAWWNAHSRGVMQLVGRGAALQRRGWLAPAAELFRRAWLAEPDSRLLRTAFRNSLCALGLDDAEANAVLSISPAMGSAGEIDKH
jgi:hypothetical protein